MEGQTIDDGFKWFGEGFDGFPKKLPDDCVEYSIYIINEKLKNESALRARLKDIQNAATTLARNLLKDYIWQRDEFKLELVRSKDAKQAVLGGSEDTGNDPVSPLAYTLQGQTSFGDSIADEWLIVYLLRELSKDYPDAWLRVSDSDGEFLLIEAAAALPKWLDPDIATHRVWINQGSLKIIPAEITKTGPKEQVLQGSITIPQALNYLAKSSSSLIHSPSIESAAFARLNEYPTAITTTLHNALITIPRRLAYLLHSNPRYISPAIDSFYLRDPISTKPLNTKDTGTLSIPPEDFVSVSVRFTRVGYAQLHAQEYPPPPSWTAVRPHMTDAQWSLGMKLACGFEMLLQDSQQQDRRDVREMQLLLEDIESGDVDLPTDAEIKTWPRQQDDEKWLDIDFHDFEKELSGQKQGDATTAGSKSTTSANSTAGDKRSTTGETKNEDEETAQENLRKMVNRFETFLNDDTAGLDGAESDASTSATDSDADESGSSEEDDSEGEDKPSSFTDAEFESAMREMMGMPPSLIESSGLLSEARALALEMEDSDEGERDEEEEARQVMAMMEKELRGHGVLDLDKEKVKEGLVPGAGKRGTGRRVFGKGKAVGKARVEEEAGEEDLGELSSDDEDDGNDVDVGMLRNMLESFKTQEGLSGPAGSMMAALGLKMPRDDDRIREADA